MCLLVTMGLYIKDSINRFSLSTFEGLINSLLNNLHYRLSLYSD